MKLSIDNFSGIVPVLDPHSLPDSAAQTALNCTTESRKVKLRTNVPAWSDPNANLTSDVNGRTYAIINGLLKEDNVSLHQRKPATVTLTKTEYWTMATGYRGRNDSPKFQLRTNIGLKGAASTLNFTGITFDANGTTFSMTFFKPGGVYSAGIVGVNMPDAKNCELLYAGQVYPLSYSHQISIPDDDNGVYATVYIDGVEFSTSAPSAAENAAQGSVIINDTTITIKGKLIKNKSRRNYVVTYWDGRHESPPSATSAEIDVCKGDIVNLKWSSYFPNSTYTPDVAGNDPAFYIYRTGGSLSSFGYYFVGETANVPTENQPYQDKIPDYLLQEKLEIVESPQTGMQFLHFFNGSLVAAKGNHVYFSEPHILYNWPSKYEYSFASTVTGLTVSGNSVIVFVSGHSPSILRGTSPGALVQTEVSDGFECVSADTICTVAGSTYYACADGLAYISPSGEYRLITQNFFSRAQWAALVPSTMKASADNFGIRLYPASGPTYIFDLRSDGLVLSTYNAGSTFDWKTGILTFPKPVCFRVVRATTSDGTGTFTIYAGHDLEHSVTAPCSYRNGRAYRLTPNIFAREWCFEVVGSSDLLEIEAAESPAEIY